MEVLAETEIFVVRQPGRLPVCRQLCRILQQGCGLGEQMGYQFSVFAGP